MRCRTYLQICRNQDIYLSRGFCAPVMYLHWALLHCSRCDWWLIDCMGHRIHCHLDCVLSILPQLASELHFFWIQFKSGQVWGLRISLAVSKQTRTGVFSVWILHRVLVFFSCCRNYQPQPNSPQVALCGCGVKDLARVPISASSQTNTQTKMPNASRTQCGDTELSLALSRKWRQLETVDALNSSHSLSSDWVLLPSHPTSRTWVGIFTPEIQPVDLAY